MMVRATCLVTERTRIEVEPADLRQDPEDAVARQPEQVEGAGLVDDGTLWPGGTDRGRRNPRRPTWTEDEPAARGDAPAFGRGRRADDLDDVALQGGGADADRPLCGAVRPPPCIPPRKGKGGPRRRGHLGDGGLPPSRPCRIGRDASSPPPPCGEEAEVGDGSLAVLRIPLTRSFAGSTKCGGTTSTSQ